MHSLYNITVTSLSIILVAHLFPHLVVDPETLGWEGSKNQILPVLFFRLGHRDQGNAIIQVINQKSCIAHLMQVLPNPQLNFSIYTFANRNVAVKLKPNQQSVMTKGSTAGAALQFILSHIPNDATSAISPTPSTNISYHK